jgi:hypothetical protein
MIWRALTFLALLTSVAAFAIAVMAYQHAGGDLKQIGQLVQSTRRGTANALDKVEDFVRGHQRGRAEDVRKK